MELIDLVSLDGMLSELARRHLINGRRNLFNFYEAQGYSDAWLNLLRKNLPRVRSLCICRFRACIVESLWRLKMRASGRFYALITSSL